MQALTAIEFYFSGRTAHAGAAPHLGRSALDAVELMNVGANYLREHVLDGTRIHYQITNGGMAPNVVPDKASVYYFLRGANRQQVEELEERLAKVAQGAAMMTETAVHWEIKSGCYETLPNETLNELMYKQVEAAGPFTFTNEEEKFAEELLQTVEPSVLAGAKNNLMSANASKTLDTDFYHNMEHFGLTIGGSSDVGDVSWIAPMGQVMTYVHHSGFNSTHGRHGLIWIIHWSERNALCSENHGINGLRPAAGSRWASLKKQKLNS